MNYVEIAREIYFSQKTGKICDMVFDHVDKISESKHDVIENCNKILDEIENLISQEIHSVTTYQAWGLL